MKIKSRIGVWCVPAIVAASLLLFGTSIGADDSQRYLENFKVFEPAKPLLDPDIQIKAEFVKGKGARIGHVQKIQGKVYVIHKGEKVAYVLKKKLPLFTGDTLITEKRSRVNAAMNDKSVFAVAPLSKLVIDKSVYDPEKNTRNSLMSVLWGQVRFIADKVAGKPNFTVKTKTAVCGVRGSDFAISVGPAGENTSSMQKQRNFFADLFLVKEAHAFVPGVLMTTVVTGSATTVGFAGTVGAMQVVGANSLCAAVAGVTAVAPVAIGAAAASAVLNSVGPGLATLSMPPEYQ
jgi:hypothetical protein